MAHVRTQIRTWLGSHLAGSPDAGSRVFERRSLPLEKNLSPALIYSVQNELSSDVSMDGTQERNVSIRVTACAKGDAAETENILDRLALFVEAVFADAGDMGGLIATYAYQSTEFSFAGDGEKSLCTAALTFALMLHTKRDDPETAL